MMLDGQIRGHFISRGKVSMSPQSLGSSDYKHFCLDQMDRRSYGQIPIHFLSVLHMDKSEE